MEHFFPRYFRLYSLQISESFFLYNLSNAPNKVTACLTQFFSFAIFSFSFANYHHLYIVYCWIHKSAFLQDDFNEVLIMLT